MRHFFYSVFSFSVLFFSFSCLSDSYDSSASQPNHRITCIIPSRPDTVFWKEIDESIRTAADDLHFDLTMIYTENTERSIVMDLNDAIETALLSDTEAIITSYTKADAETDELLLEARNAGIYVVLIDCDAPAQLRDLYVGIDNEAAGYAVGTYVRDHLAEGEKALLCYTISNQDSQNLTERVDGITRAFQSCPDALEIFSFSDSNDLIRLMELEEYLMQDDSVTALIATRERITITLAQLLSRLHLTDQIPLYGFDQSDETMQLLEDERLRALVCQQHYEMGYQSVVLASDLIDGTTPVSDFYKIDFLILSDAETEVLP